LGSTPNEPAFDAGNAMAQMRRLPVRTPAARDLRTAIVETRAMVKLSYAELDRRLSAREATRER
jgi:hypothetical protein